MTSRFEDPSKYSHFPIDYPELEEYYQLQKSVHWTPQEIEYKNDRFDFEKLSEGTQRFIKFILCFFAQADGIVNENLMENFVQETSTLKEAGKFYKAQAYIEQIHNETYSLLIETIITNPEEKRKAYSAIREYPSIGKLADWMEKWMNRDIPLLQRVVAFACVEGVMFSSAFAGVYWIKNKNVMKGLCKANEFIARDEGIHTRFALELYRTMTRNGYEKLSKDEIHSIVRSAADVSEKFIRDALKVDLIGLSSDEMVKYMRSTADYIASSLDVEEPFGETNPFKWMSVIGLTNKTNFHEDRVTEYGTVVDNGDISDDEDF